MTPATQHGQSRLARARLGGGSTGDSKFPPPPPRRTQRVARQMRTRSQSRSLADSSRGSNSGDNAAPTESEVIKSPLLLQFCCRLDPSGPCARSETQVSNILCLAHPFIYSTESYLSKKRARRRPADPSASSIEDNLDGFDASHGVVKW